MNPGDTALVCASVYDERVHITRSATPGSPITFEAQGAVQLHGFNVREADYITIRGFHVISTVCDLEDGP